MNYLDLLRQSSDRFGSLVCLGLDPVLENIPLEGTPGERILEFYETMISRMVSAKVCPSAVKPNYAFYAQYGLEGISALKKVIDICREAGLPVILDVKRGDIGTTARAYAGEAMTFSGPTP
jgi:orotidine-5'-phosphate decarboxylase